MNVNPSLVGPGTFRFLLALVVVVHHSFPLRLGACAVYLFFILSGYWIARMWEQKYRHTRNPVFTFFVSRWWRLAPVFFVCTGLALIAADPRPPEGLSCTWFVRRFLIIGLPADGFPLPPSWSLGVEAQFYLIAPALLWLLSKSHGFILPVGLPLAGLCFLYKNLQIPDQHWSLLSTGLLPYLVFFLCGVAIFRWSWKPSRFVVLTSVNIFVAITLLGLFFGETRNALWWRGGAGGNEVLNEIWSGVGALLLLPFVAINTCGGSHGRDRFFGHWAYPLYLFHWLPRDWYYRYADLAQYPWQKVLLLGANLAAALGGAFLILTLLDGPIDRLRTRWVQGRLGRNVLGSNSSSISFASWTGSLPR